MASRYSSVSRSLMAAARSSAARPATVPRPRLPSSATQSRRFFSSRSPVELGCVPSLFPLHSAVATSRLTSHVSVSVRACCELSQDSTILFYLKNLPLQNQVQPCDVNFQWLDNFSGT